MRPRIALKVFSAIAFLGGPFVATKVVLRELTPVTIITVRFAPGLVVLISIVILNRGWSPNTGLSVIQHRDWGWFLFLDFKGSFVHQLLQINGLASTSAINAGWMVAFTPVFTALLAWLLMKEVFGPTYVFGWRSQCSVRC
jgi:drug/metabolite transporter (DMT)-like permease